MKSKTYNDFDAFAESVGDVNSRMMFRNPTKRIWSTASQELDGINIQIGRLGSGNIVQGELRSDGYMIYLPLTDAAEYSANGSVLEKNTFAVLEPGCDFLVSTKEEHDWCVLFVQSSLLPQEKDLTENHSCRVTQPNYYLRNQFQNSVLQLMKSAEKCSHFESTIAAKNASTELLSITKKVLGRELVAESTLEGRPRIPRKKIIDISMSLLDDQIEYPIKVNDLAEAANVSQRTLRTVFNEYFGVGPVLFMQLRQLHQIHRILKFSNPEETKISQVLINHGEWHFSRFASRYRKLFNELPSETLQKK